MGRYSTHFLEDRRLATFRVRCGRSWRTIGRGASWSVRLENVDCRPCLRRSEEGRRILAVMDGIPDQVEKAIEALRDIPIMPNLAEKG